MNLELILPLLIIFEECLRGVSEKSVEPDCPDATLEIGICLHTYLERDFTGLEPYVEPFRGRTPIVNDPEIQIHCNNLKKLVVCYSQLDGSCGHMLKRERFSNMLNGMFTLYFWICDNKGKNLKILLENLHCIERVRQTSECRLKGLPENIWQQMLRLEVGTSVCGHLRRHVSCFADRQVMQNTCDNQTHSLFIHGMNTWLQNWCFDEPAAALNHFHSSFLFIICVVLLLINESFVRCS